MIKRLRQLFIISTLLVSALSLKAQNSLKQGDKQFELFNYIKAIDLYEQAYKKQKSLHAAERLTTAYTLTKNYVQAESWAAIAVGLPDSKPANVLAYAKALQQNSKYTEAKKNFVRYFGFQTGIDANQKQLWIASCDSAMKWMKYPERLDITNEKGLNSEQSDWAAVNYNGVVVFTSDRGTGKIKTESTRPFLKFDGTVWPSKNLYGWTGNSYLKLYVKEAGKDSLGLFPLTSVSDYHVGATSFTADGNTVYFTLTRIPKKIKRLKKKPSTINVELYSSKKDSAGNWASPKAFAFNNVNEYSVSDPFITTDGSRLYFTSNMPGGAGGSDIYYCEISNGTFSNPVNVKELNTPGNERSPVVAPNGDFYFSTDGRVGMGGLDIFLAKWKDNQNVDIQNLKYPLNSPQDDFGFSLDTNGNIVFFSSDRTDGLGQDDIYSLKTLANVSVKLIGKVLNVATKVPVANALVMLSKEDGGVLKVETDETGAYSFNLSPSSKYTLAGIKAGMLTDVQEINVGNVTSTAIIEKDLHLKNIELNKAIRIENIYYDFDKSNIRPDAATELDKLVKVLQNNPTIWIELGSHTDSRGKDAYNLGLSQRRADAAIAYIISKGINANRLTAKGYGETQLVNACKNGESCTEEAHQQNRRTEFKIVKI